MERLEIRALLSSTPFNAFGISSNEITKPDFEFSIGQDPANQITALIGINEGDSDNDKPAVGELIPLGFDPGEDVAIDIRGSIDELLFASTIAVTEDNGSIPLATPTNLATGGLVTARATIGDGPFGGTSGDYDWFEINDVEAGQLITVEVDTDAAGSALDPAIAIYDSVGNVLAINDDFGFSFDSYLVFTAPRNGDYFVVVQSWPVPQALQLDPFDSGSGVVFPGISTVGDYDVTIGLDAVDVDFYELELDAGDILGANIKGAAKNIMLLSADGEELHGSSQEIGSFLYPESSPLPTGGDASLSYVIDTTGTYFVRAIGPFAGDYDLNLRVFRPALEQEAPGTQQILFLDFDGETIDTGIYGLPGQASLSPMRDFLPNWDLSLGFENAVIDSVISVVTENFRDVGLIGNNGDFATTDLDGDFGIEILNSRDHADPFGQPNVSRIIIGGTIPEFRIPTLGIAQSIDVGNFETEETAVVLLDILSSVAVPGFIGDSINQYIVENGATKVDLIGNGVGNIVSHEAGHFFGNWHTDNANATANIMDQGGNGIDDAVGVGPDRILGTTDDVDFDFATDVYIPNEGFTGVEDSINVIAFGLSTGANLSKGEGNVVPMSTISGTKWNDLDGDGIRDNDEPGLDSVYIYADLDRDGQPGVGEPADITASDGSYEIVGIPAGEHVIREVVPFRFKQTFPDPTDLGGHLVSLAPGETVTDINFGNQASVDYGDAPISYSTRAVDDGPSHGVVSSFRLGASVDGESDGIPDPGALGDDFTGVLDEDGVEFTSGLIFAEVAEITVTASTDVGILQGWIDFNADGDFADPGEQIVTDLLLSAGANTIFVPVPAAPLGQSGDAETFARFRYGIERGISFTGAARLGEVEDYAVRVKLPPQDGLTANDDSKIVQEDSVGIVVDVLANDTLIGGSGMKLISSVTAPDMGGTVIVDGGSRLLYTPAPNFFGRETFVYTASDGVAESDTATVTIDVVNVNDDPTARDDSFPVGRNSTDVFLNVLTNDTDPEGDMLRVTAIGSTDGGGTVTISPEGTGILYTPAPGFAGTETFSYTIGDGNGGSDDAVVSIDVDKAAILVDFRLEVTNLDETPVSSVDVGGQFLLRGFVSDVRDVPVGVFAAYVDVLYDSALTSVGGDITFGPAFENGRSGITSTAGILDEVGAFDGFDPLGPGEFLLFEVPFSADAVGDVTFTSDPADVVPRHTVLLIDINDSPVPNDSINFGVTSVEIVEFAARDDILEVTEDSVDNDLDVLANDLAGAGGPFSITSVGPTDNGGAVEIAAGGGSLIYTPVMDFLGTETFTYTITSDGTGTQSTATVMVAVVPDATPRARDDVFTVATGSEITEDTSSNPLDVLANDIVTPGFTLEISLPFGTFITSNGSRVTNDGGARLLYSPADDFFGTETFTYTIEDGIGNPSEATVTVEVVNVNDPPTANNDAFDVDEDSTLNTLDVLANDTFLPDPIEAITITDVGTPDNGGSVEIRPDGQRLIYTPLAEFVGTETFTYEIEDDGDPAMSATATVSVDVGLDDLVGIRLHTTDTLGQPISSVEIGQDFQLQVFVDDLRLLAQGEGGVFSAYIDVLFDSDLVSVVNDAGNPLGFDITFGELGTYENGHKGSIETPGQIDEVGAFDGFAPLGSDEALLFTVRLHADNLGQFDFEGNSAEDPNSEVLLFDFDTAVIAGRIDFGQPLEFEVVDLAQPFTNVLRPNDVNADGRVTPLDALLIINVLNRQGAQKLTQDFAASIPDDKLPAQFLPDVNHDGRISPLDALLIINELNAPPASTIDGGGEVLVASADGVSRGLSMMVVAEEMAAAIEQEVVADVGLPMGATLLVDVAKFEPSTNDLGGAYLADDSQDMTAIDVVLDEATAWVEKAGDSPTNLLASDGSVSDDGIASAWELDPVLSDIAEDVAIAWLK